jgi:hypothetical protein
MRTGSDFGTDANAFDFSQLGASDATARISPDEFSAARSGAAPSATSNAFDFSSIAPASQSEWASEPAAPQPRRSPAPAQSVGAFDFSSLQTGAATTQPGAKANSPFDFAALGPASSPPQASQANNPFQFAALESAPPPAPIPSAFGSKVPESDFASASRFGQASQTLDDDLNAPPAAPLAMDQERNALFDMAAALPAPPPEVEPVEQPAPAEAATIPLGRISAPRAPPVPPEEPPKRKWSWRIVANAIVAMVLAAAAYVLGLALLNEGRFSFDDESAEPKNQNYPVSDISNGLYSTATGRPVFFVRGVVENATSEPARLLVRAEIVEGRSVVRSSELPLGRPATPEEIFALDGQENGEQLFSRLLTERPELAPHSSADFLIVFFEYPPELEGFRVRVSAKPAEHVSAK